MNKLPRKLPSGKKLVATAADGRVGLYCKGKTRKETSKYIIMNRKGKKSRGLMGSGGYPIAPNDLKWAWLDKEKKRKKHRRAAKKYIDPRPGYASVSTKPHVSIIGLCVECKRETRKLSHAHTLSHPDKGHAQIFCCTCARMMGYKCATHKKMVEDKEYEERWTLVA